MRKAFAALPPAQGEAVRSFLDSRLPAESLDSDLVEFMLGADPADRVLHENPETGRLEYRVPVSLERQDPWPVPAPPSLSPTGSCCGGSSPAKGLAGAGFAANGWASPVTPEMEATSAASEQLR